MKNAGEAVFNSDDICVIDAGLIRKLKARACALPRKRFRFCLHDSNDHALQEMIIAAAYGSYIRPHRHPAGKSESYHVIEGTMTVYYFDDHGNKIRKVKLGGRGPLIQRLSENLWHCPVPTSDWVVYHETYPGPFIKDIDVEYAPWAPEENNIPGVLKFFNQLRAKGSF